MNPTLDQRQKELRERMKSSESRGITKHVFSADNLRIRTDEQGNLLYVNASNAVLKPAQVRELMTALHRFLNPVSSATVRFRYTDIGVYTKDGSKRAGEYPSQRGRQIQWSTSLKDFIYYLQQAMKHGPDNPYKGWTPSEGDTYHTDIKVYVSRRVRGKWQNEYKARQITPEEFLKQFGSEVAK